MKPHIVLMALGVWLLTARRLAGEYPRPWRAAGADLLGNLLGGLAAGLPGVLWLVASGTWGAFLDVFEVWNPNYMKLAAHEFDMRVSQELHWFPPWSLGLVITVPLALLSVLDMAPWSSRERDVARPGAGWLGRWLPWWLWDKTAGADARFARGVLGGLYLVWAAQAFFVQRGFQYAHVPETLLMFGLWAAHRWAWAALGLLWLAVTSGLWLAAEGSPDVKGWLEARPEQVRERYFPRHLITNTSRLRLWPECWRTNMTDAERYALWDKLRLHPPHEASIDWGELAEVAAFLRTRETADGAPLRGRVVAWFDSPHAVYLMLDIDPGFRFMHVYTAISIWVGKDPTGEIGRRRVLDEFDRTIKKRRKALGPDVPIYVVSDLQWVALSADDNEEARKAFLGPAHAPANNHWLPTVVPYPKEFPWNQPTVFRTRGGAGRYVVHRLVSPNDSPDRPRPEE